MLGLKLPTDPRWVNMAEMKLEEILTDHAYCEQKAATACISLIQTYPDKSQLVESLAPIVSEEWSHFMLVLAELKKRDLQLGWQRRDDYVNALIAFEKKGKSREERLTERLLACALIEARSCERFRLISLHIQDDNLKQFYHGFMVSEAGHYRLFIELAYLYGGEDNVKARWEEYLAFEAVMIAGLPLRGDRIH
ncbi:MAG: tRNA-(ms[2]io[6]A)-hydroxylase [Bacteroidota bacterium]|nr:tRNA-(ms[2]io[6]A)-hydroxylase [Bacteroidota bacterium]